MKRLILIRHGETADHLAGKYCGFTDPSLNNKGRRQAERLAAKLKDARVDAVYSSDLRRAYETAAIIFKSKTIKKMPELREMNFGIFEGLKYREIVRKYPEVYRDWINDPSKIKVPAGESFGTFSRRVKDALSFILSWRKKGVIAVVTHAGPIRVIFGVEQEIATYTIIEYP